MSVYAVNVVTTHDEMNVSEKNNDLSTQIEQFDVMMLLQCIIASVGIIANLTVITVFLNHKELRRKIPNRFIINQVNISFYFKFSQSLCISTSTSNVISSVFLSSTFIRTDDKLHSSISSFKYLSYLLLKLALSFTNSMVHI